MNYKDNADGKNCKDSRRKIPEGIKRINLLKPIFPFFRLLKYWTVELLPFSLL